MNKKTLLVDMDNTICHYTKAWEEARQKLPLQMFPQSQYGFYLGLKPIDGVIHFIDQLREFYDVWFCTKLSDKNPMSSAEKMLWIKIHFGEEWVNKLIITPDKGMIIGDILVDDCPWPSFKGEQILFHNETNNWFKIIKQLKDG